MSGRGCLLALAAGGRGHFRTVFRGWGSRELRDGTCVRLDDTVVFTSSGTRQQNRVTPGGLTLAVACRWTGCRPLASW